MQTVIEERSKNKYYFGSVRLPDFFVIGAQRCGTTWLHSMLRQHPEIYLSTQKEIHFFDWKFDKGWDWYAKFYKDVKSEKVVGEITPSYYYEDGVMEKLERYFPSAKIVVVLRHPVDRAYSQYWRHKGSLLVKESFEDALDRFPHIIERSLYYQKLKRVWELFPQERVRVFIYEEMMAKPDKGLTEMFNFLGVDERFRPSYLETYVNAAKHHRFQCVASTLVSLRRTMRNWGMSRLLDFLRKLGLKKLLLRISMTRTSYPIVLDPGTRARIFKQYFSDDVVSLESAIGRPIGDWKR